MPQKQKKKHVTNSGGYTFLFSTISTKFWATNSEKVDQPNQNKKKLSKLNTMLMLNDFMQTITNNFKIWWTDAFIKDEKRFKF